VEIEALVDTGATMLILPADVVARLGLKEQGRRKVVYANGAEEEIPWIGGVRLTLLGREMIASALVVPAGTTALIGQIPLEELDLIVDPKSRALRVNPASPDAPRLDLLSAA
jgi:clan AA aspartic protease